MVKRIYVLFVILVVVLTGFTLSSCTLESNNSSDKSNEYVLYLDNGLIENDKIKVEFDASCSGYDQYWLNVSVKITNKEYSTNTYEFKNLNLNKEDTGATYTIGNTFSNKLTIEAELNKRISFSSTIPTSLKNDKYKMSLELNNYKIIYYLYETPDDLRLDRTISYSIGNEIVYKEIVKDKRKLENKYVYESSDNLYYCDTWYTDSTLQKTMDYSNSITEDIVLYGKVKSNILWRALSGDAYYSVSGINHIPSNKILVIPSAYNGMEIGISAYAIYNISVNEIYVPKTVHIIYGGNFISIGSAKICYEGTEEEWKALFYISLDVVTTNVYYNVKYNG